MRRGDAHGPVGTGLTGNDIAAVGITNQRETTVIWERATGRPVHNALVWQDTRTDRLCNRWVADGLEQEIARRSGLPVSPYFASSKIRWILEHIDDGMARARRGELCFGTIDAWLLLQLSADRRHVTDVTNASRTMCMNLETLNWDESLLAALDIPAAILPTIAPSSSPDALGATAADGPLGARVPICGILGDQQAATVGQACLTPGEAKNTYGTGCFLILNTGRGDPAQRQGVDFHGGLPVRRPAGRLCPGGVGGHGRRHGAVAARRNADD